MNAAASNAWLAEAAMVPNADAAASAAQRQRCLTKPPGSLGRLEEIAIRLAGMQGVECPIIEKVAVTVFAADHGIAAAGVSAFPQSVTAAMVANFLAGGAAISVAAKALGAELSIVDVGVAHPIPRHPPSDTPLLLRAVAAGTADSRSAPAMTEAQLATALDAGREAVDRAVHAEAQLFIAGEMGIANTTAAAALACMATGEAATVLCGPGTGLDTLGVAHKVAIVEQMLCRHTEAAQGQPLAQLRRVGGFEIAALVGALVRCAQRGVPVLIDGFIVSVAALIARQLCPGLDDWSFYAHRSAEPGHRSVLAHCAAQPLLDLDMRLGEGSGAAAAVPLLRLACALHAGMATFEEAGVADGGQ